MPVQRYRRAFTAQHLTICSIFSIIMILCVSLIIPLCFYAIDRENRPEIMRREAEGRGSDLHHRLQNHDQLPAEDKGMNYIIFDAFSFEGSLEFLNDQQRHWVVIVINVDVDKVDASSCRTCMFFHHEMVKVYFDEPMSNVTIAPFVKNKMAVYRYVLSKNANWIYTTNKPRMVPYASLHRVIDIKDDLTDGLVYDGPDDVFNPCRHIVDPFVWPGSGHQRNQIHYRLRPVSRVSIFYVVDECYKRNMNKDSWHVCKLEQPIH